MANPWAKFLDLLPKTPKYIGTIESAAGDLYYVQLLDGGLVEAQSADTYSLGARVYVKDGKIDGVAPTLPLENIEV